MPQSATPSALTLPQRLRLVSADRAHSIFILNAYLRRLGKRTGIHYQQWFSRWLATGLSQEEELYLWLQEQHVAPVSRRRLFGNACKQAQLWHRQGIWAAVRAPLPNLPAESVWQCPQVLFGLNGGDQQLRWTAFFNSRKSRLIHPDDTWLTVFRNALPSIAPNGQGVASSLGTSFYDLVTTASQEADTPLLLVVPFTIEQMVNGRISALFSKDHQQPWLLTCQSHAMGCPKGTHMLCRDRLLASLADMHYILEIRTRGNLQAILREQQQNDPRLQWIYRPGRKTVHNAGNFQLLEEFPHWARVLEADNLEETVANRDQTVSHTPACPKSMPAIAWQEYLYHYTRSCPGPWPEESYRDYLLHLFNKDPLSAHTALETLIRMLGEGRVRASCNLVRGNQPVISWSARPPWELQQLRKWNRALIRWTFEPYGLAVSRRVLRDCGAQPAIYTTSQNYSRLNPKHRFRFQRHEPPHCSWKIEREWRLPGDFVLESIVPTAGFIFVPNAAARQTLQSHVQCIFPIMVLRDFEKAVPEPPPTGRTGATGRVR